MFYVDLRVDMFWGFCSSSCSAVDLHDMGSRNIRVESRNIISNYCGPSVHVPSVMQLNAVFAK